MNIGDSWMDITAMVLVLVGALLCLTAAIGLLRFRDVPTRLHAATKPQVLGLGTLMTALALEIRTGVVVWTLLLVVLFQLITAPVSAHMVGRAGYRTGRVRHDLLVVDELTEDLAAVAKSAADEKSAAEKSGTP